VAKQLCSFWCEAVKQHPSFLINDVHQAPLFQSLELVPRIWIVELQPTRTSNVTRQSLTDSLLSRSAVALAILAKVKYGGKQLSEF
jgi:hypothetical protein